MAFGSTQKATSKSAQGTSEPTAWMDTREGDRIFRILPKIDEKTGKILDEPDSEVAFFVYWIELDTGSGKTRKPVIVADRYDNPIFNQMKIDYPEPKDPNRRGASQSFAVNVYDRTPVITHEGFVIYPRKGGTYFAADGTELRPTKEQIKPANVVKILTGSTGKVGGDHLLGKIVEFDGYENPTTGDVCQLHQFDLRLRTTTGDKWIDTKRTVFPTNNFAPLPEEVALADRYDIAAYAKPWPLAAIKAVMAVGTTLDQYNEIVADYKIVTTPQLKPVLF